jgi:hypothetical protein
LFSNGRRLCGIEGLAEADLVHLIGPDLIVPSVRPAPHQDAKKKGRMLPLRLSRAAGAAARDQGSPAAAPASAGGAHLPPELQGARGSGCCRPHRGRAGIRCSTPATRGGDGCADGRARRPWMAQSRTLPSGGAGQGPAKRARPDP